VTHLRQLMLDELQRRNYSPNTVRSYLHAVEEFARHFRRSPEQLGPDHVREYQVHLFRDRKLSARTIAGQTAALTVSADEFLRRFLIHVLPKGLVRIRHFGLFANRKRSASLLRCRLLLNVSAPPPQFAPTSQMMCPLCAQPMLVVDRITGYQLLLAPMNSSPPKLLFDGLT
jgi:hypothetical protein